MRICTDIEISGELAVVASISDALFRASLAELQARDDMIRAFRAALDLGIPVEELSAETGFSPGRITRMSGWNLTFGEDLSTLAGITR